MSKKSFDIESITDSFDIVDEALEKLDDAISGIDDTFHEVDTKMNTMTDKRVKEGPVIVETPQGPKIDYVEVVLRKQLSETKQKCRPSEKHEGLEFCFVEDAVRSYRYDPKVFTKATGADLEKLQKKIDECPLCKIDPEHIDQH